MKNGKHGVIAQIAGPGLVLAALLALMLSNPGIGRAQTSTASPAVTTAKSSGPPANSPDQPAAKPPAKGQSEGIHVHGHWTIEVHNPDGKLVSHTEFENALQASGQQALAALLWGFTPGDWAVILDGASGDTQLPCTSTSSNGGFAPCMIVEPGSRFSSDCVGGLPAYLSNSQCFPTLKLGSDANYQATNLALGGSLTASAASTITDVQTYLDVCSSASTPSACALNVTPTEIYEFTAATLPAQGSGLCGGANQPSCAVSVSAGQTVSVAVAISFQ